MNLPFEIKFFKKYEIYQDIKRLDGLSNIQHGGEMDNTWTLEKRILRWTYEGHKHLGSPIHLENLNPDSSESKLRQMFISPDEIKTKERDDSLWTLENLVSKGYAVWHGEELGKDYGSLGLDQKAIRKERAKGGIIITREGLLAGEVIWETTEICPVRNCIYKSKVLSLKYDIALKLGWILFILAVIEVVILLLGQVFLFDNLVTSFQVFPVNYLISALSWVFTNLGAFLVIAWFVFLLYVFGESRRILKVRLKRKCD